MTKKIYKLDMRGKSGDDLRVRLEKLLQELPLGITEVAADMGISYITLVGFLDGSRSTFRKSVWAIRSWVEEKERYRDVL